MILQFSEFPFHCILLKHSVVPVISEIYCPSDFRIRRRLYKQESYWFSYFEKNVCVLAPNGTNMHATRTLSEGAKRHDE